LRVEIVAIDITDSSAGFYMDGITERVVLPNLKSRSYPSVGWHNYIYDGNLDCIIPGSDYDLAALSNVRDEWGAFGCKVLVSDYDLVTTCNDKQATAKMLKHYNIATPRAYLSYHDLYLSSERYPVIVKPRIGSGSRGVVKVNKADDFPPMTDEMFVQEYLDGPEYTCSVFVDRFGEVIGTFQFVRKLQNGTTYKGMVTFDHHVHKLLVKIGKTFKPRGMLNVQLRVTERGPVPFELNCRCSGTTAIRAHFGYNEPEMLIQHYVLGEDLKTPKIQNGKAFRYWNETYCEELNK